MRALYATCACLMLALNAGPAWSQESDQAAARIAVGTCALCHGPHGNSEPTRFPRLAAQRENYLVAQLKAFRNQTRGDPDAIAYMWGMAAPLSDDSISALARYYASQKAVPGTRGAAAVIARGSDIYKNGIASENIPACASCHGADAEGLADFPRLAGQHAEYIIKQLRSFQNNLRDVAIMHGVAREMKLNEMEAVAAFLQSK
jgi:cytochrome c553